MPDRYKCDSCRAVVHHLNQALVKQQPKSRRQRCVGVGWGARFEDPRPRLKRPWPNVPRSLISLAYSTVFVDHNGSL
ncbi:unnamed protein product [Effrenium voratum]|uniref:Uncharacterized protein n=1 Tax=Effrenium voratum TaxID=2562239 RepID=A0AA36ILQ9_9DINO|nr:unnamed protein product [Effrenium voratum]CAJ1413136.1 unnamed protein product [Effrenium voratum]